MKINKTTDVNLLKEMYPKGCEVACLVMKDDYPVPPGTFGTVNHVDDIGQIHVDWDNGRTIALIPGVDTFAKVFES